MSLALENLTKIRQNIEKACKSWQRNYEDVSLIAVSKNFPKKDVLALLQEGQLIFGENRVQEAYEKYPELKQLYPQLQLHLIGPLQSNKAKLAVSLFDCIHTIDREKIARVLAEEMHQQKKYLPCYVQVNVGNEPQKAGIKIEETEDFVLKCQKEYHLNIIGLMCIPPVNENPGPYFALLQKKAQKITLPKLSMGMSEDYEAAICFGATAVRIGSAIFGKRIN